MFPVNQVPVVGTEINKGLLFSRPFDTAAVRNLSEEIFLQDVDTHFTLPLTTPSIQRPVRLAL